MRDNTLLREKLGPGCVEPVSAFIFSLQNSLLADSLFLLFLVILFMSMWVKSGRLEIASHKGSKGCFHELSADVVKNGHQTAIHVQTNCFQARF